jgi:hypothetical protein
MNVMPGKTTLADLRNELDLDFTSSQQSVQQSEKDNQCQPQHDEQSDIVPPLSNPPRSSNQGYNNDIAQEAEVFETTDEFDGAS